MGLRIFNGRIGWIIWRRWKLLLSQQGVSASPSCNVDASSEIGPYVSLGKYVFVGKSKIGRASYINEDCRIRNCDIGQFTSIGPGVLLGGLGKHPLDFISTHPAFYSMKQQSGVTFAAKGRYEEVFRTSIGNDVWIGARATILDGINIGDGAIIAAGAVVTRDVASYEVVGGVPALNIKFRFEEDIIKRLLDLAWWDSDISTLRQLTPHFFQKPLTEDELGRLENRFAESRSPKQSVLSSRMEGRDKLKPDDTNETSYHE